LNNSYPGKLYLALVHHPVKNKNGEIIASAVTNLDLHDISRAAKTYGAAAFYVVTPLDDQRTLVEELVSHWTTGRGGVYNPKRREALELIRVRDDLSRVIDEIRLQDGRPVKVVATRAAESGERLDFAEFRHLLAEGSCSYLLLLGTAWGLADAVLDAADYVLKPIRGNTAYNHLSVRSAAAIILDRILGHTG
jgi:hypothetical protein